MGLPVDIFVGNNFVVTLGPHRDYLHLSHLEKSVYYHGDETGKVVITGGGKIERNLNVGDGVGTTVDVTFAPIDKGEPTTTVKMPIIVRRTS